ncbi:MAG: phosphoribosylformylglycinamidine synthase subunit PurS [Armatimonadetes bacterium]|nr:phosphoribosylformylglycinamidine synthase subunit PurS [Armatimonadota bacterium]
MVSVELLVTLKIPDVTALTAANAIRRRLGYADTLAELRRADYYCLDLDVDDPDAALEMVRDMAERTNLFVNPNKHAFTVCLLDERGRAVEDNGTYTVNVLVTDPADASPAGILKSLQEMAAYGDKVQSVRRGVLWTMRLVADSEERAIAMAEDITVTRSQDQGLLMNPHFQDYEIWTGT